MSTNHPDRKPPLCSLHNIRISIIVTSTSVQNTGKRTIYRCMHYSS